MGSSPHVCVEKVGLEFRGPALGVTVAPKDRLLERDAVLAELRSLHRATVRKGGRVVLLRGEAGVGKTATIEHFLAELGKGVRVARGWCDPVTAPRALGPLADMLARASGERVQELRTAVEAGDLETVHASVSSLLGHHTTWVCVVEDVHWADGATLDLLRFLFRRIETLPLLLVVSYRDDELGDQHPLMMLLGDVATSRAMTRIELRPLTPAAVTELAIGSGVNAEELYRVTGGNPFYVTEILAASAGVSTPESLPRSISEAVWGRLARLTTVGRDTAHASAVCGPRVEVDLLMKVCPAAEKGLTECLNAGVLGADADTVGFRHELARRATLDQIPEHRRRELHKLAMTALTARSAEPDTLSALTEHADEAGDSRAVIAYGPRAAERASSLGANREAAKLYELTLSHSDDIAAEQRVVWLEKHALSSHLSGSPDVAAMSFRDAAALRRSLGDEHGEADDLRLLSSIVWLLGRTAEAVGAGQASLRMLDGAGPCPELAWSLINMAELAASTCDPRCRGYATRAITIGIEIGDQAVVTRGRAAAAMARVLTDGTGWDEVEAVWRDAVALDAGLVYAGPVAAALCWFAALHYQLGRAESYISETIALCEAHDFGAFHIFAVGAASLVAMHRGDWATALTHADAVLTRPTPALMHRILPLVSVQLVRARRGEVQHNAALLDEVLAASDSLDLGRVGIAWAARAEAQWLAGDDDAAHATARTGLAMATEHADPWLAGALRRWARLTGDSIGDSLATDTVTPFGMEVAGDWRAAAAEWMRLGCSYDAAVAQLGGDIDAVEAALATFRTQGARAAARRAQQQLATLRGRTADTRRRATVADPHGLTPRERDVLELIAAGHTDAGIAATLFISPKTANRHVGSILAKLGVRNRTQAAAYARSHSAPAG